MTAPPTTSPPRARRPDTRHTAAPRAVSSALRRLGQTPEARRLLLGSAALSAAQLACTVAAWLLAARAIQALTFEVRSVGSLWPTLAGVAVALTLRALLAAAREAASGTAAARLVGGLRARLLARLSALGPVALSGERGAELVTSAQAGVSRLTPYFARYLPQAAHAGVYALGILAALLLTDPLSALIVAVTLPVCVMFLWLVGLAAGEATRRQWTGLTRLNARLVGAARTLPTLRAYGAAHARAEGLAREAQAHRAATLAVLRAAFLNGFVLDLAATLSVALVAVTVGVRLFEGHLSFAPALAALLLVPEAFAPMRQLGSDRHAAMEAEPAAERVMDLLEMPGVPAGDVVLDSLPAVELRQVNAVLAGRKVLSNLNLSVPAGGRVAITGPSGSGKTTLLHGLLKYVPLDGTAEVNGVPLAELETVAWRAGAAFVTQRPRFLAGSLQENLLAARSDATEADLIQALHIVGLLAPLDTPISEDGHPLSGGERVRLALARVLLSDACLLLLDEPTAHLDPRAEVGLLDRLAPHLQGRTVLLVTHRHVPAGFECHELRDGRLHPIPEAVPA